MALITTFNALLAVALAGAFLGRSGWVLIAFLFGVLRAPASILDLMGILPVSGPTWYLVFQAILGLLQFGIGLLMVAGYRQYHLRQRWYSTADVRSRAALVMWAERLGIIRQAIDRGRVGNHSINSAELARG